MYHLRLCSSAFSYPFVELNSPEKLAGFSEAVQSLRALVLHEQKDVTVQVRVHLEVVVDDTWYEARIPQGYL